MKFESKAIHAAYNPDEHNRAIMPPIYQNSMFAMKEIGEQIPFRYSRLSNPTRQILEDTLAELENGSAGFAFSSGVAAIDAVWRALLEPKDTIVAVADIYGGSFDLLNDIYAKWGINVLFADLTEAENLENILKNQRVRMLWLETPSNPLLRLVDIQKLSEIAHKYGTIVGIDNTFATPYLQNPLDLGCDIVVHSATKYLCGHSDVLMGITVTKNKEQAVAIKNMQIHSGAVAAPIDCAFVLRGIKTLAIRMDRHQENAQIIAERLANHPAIEQVFYPGLENNPFHQLAKKQMRGFGGVVSVYLKNDTRSAANAVIKSLKLIQMSSSLGGVESLVNHSSSQSHSGLPQENKDKLGIREGLLRFSIGIENVEDIWADINQALEAVKQ
ncbi:MAG: PLP-dependent transferase [Cardiobacteriaceae bacterium]|nr:PLP-dependent transferase [Cardiobacteriaceae bacterium]